MTYLCYRTEADQLTVWRDIGMFWLLQGTTEQLTYLALIGRQSLLFSYRWKTSTEC